MGPWFGFRVHYTRRAALGQSRGVADGVMGEPRIESYSNSCGVSDLRVGSGGVWEWGSHIAL